MDVGGSYLGHHGWIEKQKSPGVQVGIRVFASRCVLRSRKVMTRRSTGASSSEVNYSLYMRPTADQRRACSAAESGGGLYSGAVHVQVFPKQQACNGVVRGSLVFDRRASGCFVKN